jgi:hypothetical protein
MGYANTVVHMDFSDLSEDPVGDPIWISVRNFKMMSPGELAPRDIPLDADGKPIDPEQAQQAMYEVLAKTIIGWRVYDANSLEVDPETGTPLPMRRLESPPTPARVACLPVEIINRLSDEMAKAVNPPSDSASPTTKTSSSLPSPSTTELGEAQGQSLAS